MSTIETVLMSLLVLDAIGLTVLVILQQGKGADVGAAFGSGSSNTMFGSAGGSSFLTKATAWLAIGFFVIAFSLAYIAKQRAESAGSIGIPTVPTQGETPQLTPQEESVDSPAGDIPSLGEADEVDQVMQEVVEEVKEAVEAAAQGDEPDGDIPKI